MQRLTAISCLSLLAACTSAPPPAPEGSPEVRVGRLFPKPENLTTGKISVSVEMFNPRSTPVKVTSIEYTVKPEGLAVVQGTVKGGAVLEADQAASLEFDVTIPYPEDKEGFLALMEKEGVPLDVKGAVTFDTGSKVAFERKGEVATPSLPKLIVHDAQAARYGEEGLDATFFLRLVNENPFAVTVGDVTYTVAIEGKDLKTEQGAIGTRLPQGAVQEFEVNVVLEEKSFEQTKAVLAAGKMDYVVKGRVSVKDLEVPFEHEGSINLATGE